MKKYIKSVADLQRIYNQGQSISFTDLDNSFDEDSQSSRGSLLTSDKGQEEEATLGHLQAIWLQSKLTKKQQTLIEIMKMERKRRKVAKELGVSLQAVNQMILRVRRRIEMWSAFAE